MYKQWRILIGDIGDPTSFLCADYFRKRGCWTITQPQITKRMLNTFRNMHPDYIILYHCVGAMDLLAFIEQVKMSSNVRVLVLFPDEAPDALRTYQSKHVICLSIPDSIDGLVNLLELHLRRSLREQRPLIRRVDVEFEATKILHAMQVPANLNGYHYLRYAIMLAVCKKDFVLQQMSDLYPEISKVYQTTENCIERAIRHAIAQGWNNIPADRSAFAVRLPFLQYYRRPSNAEFIADISDWIRMRIELEDCDLEVI